MIDNIQALTRDYILSEIDEDEAKEWCRGRALVTSDQMPNYHYWGGVWDEFGWSFVPGFYRATWDQSMIYDSNKEVVLNWLETHAPDDYAIEEDGGAWGRIERLMARFVEEDGTPTLAGLGMFYFYQAIDNYPVLNEDRLSEMEMERLDEFIREDLGWELSRKIGCDVDDLPEDYQQRLNELDNRYTIFEVVDDGYVHISWRDIEREFPEWFEEVHDNA